MPFCIRDEGIGLISILDFGFTITSAWLLALGQDWRSLSVRRRNQHWKFDWQGNSGFDCVSTFQNAKPSEWSVKKARILGHSEGDLCWG